jgi:hypothetical protein
MPKTFYIFFIIFLQEISLQNLTSIAAVIPDASAIPLLSITLSDFFYLTFVNRQLNYPASNKKNEDST